MKRIILFFVLLHSVSYGQVVINEVMHKPGPNTSTNQGFRRKEYVEIYNKGCSPVNIGCWVIASANQGIGTVANPTYIGAFQFPAGTIINPGQHLVIGGTESQNGTGYAAGDIDFKVADFVGTNTCDPNTNWLLPNGDAWVALYNNTGTPIDAIYWSFSSTQPNLATDDDFASSPCVPTACGGITSLKSARQIAASNPGTISFVGAATANDKTFSRVPDGGAWQRDINPSITGNQCNNGQCATTSSFNLAATSINPGCGSSNGSITFNSPASNYQFVWSPNVSTSASASNLPAGAYAITVTSPAGCSKDTTITLSGSGGPTAIVVTPTNPSCSQSNGSVQLGSVTGGTAPYQYNFNGTGNSTTTNYSNLAAGSFSLSVTDANGCSYSAPAIVLTSSSGPTAIVVTPTNPSCAQSNGAVQLGAVTGGVAPYQYNFNSLGYSTTTSYNNLGAGSYSLLVQDANGCVYTNPSIQLSNGNGPSNVQVTVQNESCDQANGSVTIGNVTGGVAPYQYNFNNSGFSSQLVYANLSSGTYSLVVQDANGCSYSAPSINVTEVSGPTAVQTTAQNASCGQSNGSVQIGQVTGGTPPYLYNFNGEGAVSTTNYNGLGTGSYSLTVVDANGCDYLANPISISNTDGPTAVVVTSTDEKCTLENGAVQIGQVTGGVSPFTYDFNGLGFGVVTQYSGLAAGSYTLSVKDAAGCIFQAPVINIVNIEGPTDIVTTVENATCGENNGSITVVSISGGTAPYTIQFPGQTGGTQQQFTQLEGGAYAMLITDATGCLYSEDVVVEAGAVPEADFTANPFVMSIFDPITEVYNQSTSDVTNLTWYVEGGSPSVAYTENVSLNFSGQEEGEYDITLVVVNQDGCVDSITKIVKIVPEILFYAPNAFTPDGDQYNNEWKIFLSNADPSSFSMQIFNRWGEKIFETADTEIGWNGFYKGEMVQDGTYTWQVSFKDLQTDERFIYQGHLTMFR